MGDITNLSECDAFHDALYHENGDSFVVCARRIPDERGRRFQIFVKYVIANDPCHGIQYKAGDQFEVFWNDRDPNPLTIFWDLVFTTVACLHPVSAYPKTDKSEGRAGGGSDV